MLVVAVVCGGCFVDVDFANTRFSCEKDGSCPGGYECVENTCVAESAPAVDGGGGADGAAGGGDGSLVEDGDASIEVEQCGAVEVEIELGVSHTGTTVGGGAALECNCNSCPGPEVVHRLVIEDAPVTLTATTDLAGTGYDAIIYARRACDQPDTDLACNDDGQGDTITFEADVAGTYYIVIDSHEGESGNYELLVTEP